MTEIDRIAKWTAVASAYAVAGAALYAAGYFKTIGSLWLPMITTTEMIAFFAVSSHNLIVISGITIGMLFSISVGLKTILATPAIFQKIEQYHNEHTKIIVMFLAVGITLCFISYLRYEVMHTNGTSNIRFNQNMVAVCLGVAISYNYLKEHSEVVPYGAIFVISTMLYSCYLAGSDAAHRRLKQEFYVNITHPSGGLECQKLIFAGSNGIIVQDMKAATKSRMFIQDEDYARISTGTCTDKEKPEPKARSLTATSAGTPAR